jgi:hypothetical protein
MAMVKDIDLETDLDLKIIDGDFAISDSDQNHVINILKAYVGGYKQFPLVGVGIDYYLASAGTQQVIKRNITVQMESDGYKVNKIEVLGQSKYSIDANRII